MAQQTAKNWGVAALLALLFWPKKGAAAPSSPAIPTAPPGERPAPSPRPEASKVEPSSLPTRGDEEELPGDDAAARLRARLAKEEADREALEKAEKEAAAALAAKKKAAKKKADGDDDDEKKPKPAKKSTLTKEERGIREKRAQQFSARQHQVYTEEGHLPEIAAAEALVSYLLAGGASPTFIKQYQHMMGIPESGAFDLSTQTKVEELLDSGVVLAANNMLLEGIKGEDPAQAAAESLALYVIAAQESGGRIVIPREWMSALQMQFMLAFDGTYNQATRDALVKHGITPP